MGREFKPRRSPLLVSAVIWELLEAARSRKPCVEATLDLWLSRETVEIRGGTAVLRGHKVSLTLLEGILGRTSSRDVWVVLGDDSVAKVQMYRSGSFYKLRNVEGTAPTLEINGVHMHRVEGVTPWADAGMKIGAAGVARGSRVLDTATGLGYTAIHAARRGARVVTVEKDASVLEIAAYNPWSYGLSSESVSLVLGDVAEKVLELPDSYFTHVVHDPPRYSLSPEMYSEGLYRELYKKLRPGGVLLHYVGEPGRVHGLNLPGRVASRLKKTGFSGVRYLRGIMCLLARRPA